MREKKKPRQLWCQLGVPQFRRDDPWAMRVKAERGAAQFYHVQHAFGALMWYYETTGDASWLSENVCCSGERSRVQNWIWELWVNWRRLKRVCLKRKKGKRKRRNGGNPHLKGRWELRNAYESTLRIVLGWWEKLREWCNLLAYIEEMRKRALCIAVTVKE